MTGSVREEILTRVRAVLALLPGLGTKPGTVVKAVYDEVELEEKSISEIVTVQQKRAVEVLIGEDEPIEIENEITGADGMRFRVGVLIHLPDAVPEESSYAIEAARAYTDVHILYASPTDQLAGTWQGYATQTRDLGGGAVFISEYGTRATFAMFEIDYRHKWGAPQEVV